MKNPSRCPVCWQPDGFHDRVVHDAYPISPKHLKQKNWHKEKKRGR